jgi:hypothetical protein
VHPQGDRFGPVLALNPPGGRWPPALVLGFAAVEGAALAQAAPKLAQVLGGAGR